MPADKDLPTSSPPVDQTRNFYDQLRSRVLEKRLELKDSDQLELVEWFLRQVDLQEEMTAAVLIDFITKQRKKIHDILREGGL